MANGKSRDCPLEQISGFWQEFGGQKPLRERVLTEPIRNQKDHAFQVQASRVAATFIQNLLFLALLEMARME